MSFVFFSSSNIGPTTNVMSSSSVHLEDVIKELGGCGRFQIILVFIIHTMKCVVCFTMVTMVFGAAVPDWWCMDDFIGQNVSDVIGKKNITQFQSCSSANGTKVCSNFLYADTMRTVVTEVFTADSRYLKAC